jgi:excisionase family DNA binding protein
MVTTLPPHLNARASAYDGPLRRPRHVPRARPHSAKSAYGQPYRHAARGHRAQPCRVPGYCHCLDNARGAGAGCLRFRAAGQPVLLLPGWHRRPDTRRNQHGAGGHRPGFPPTGSRHSETAHLRRPGAAVTITRGNRELDDVAAGERASVRHRAARRTAPVGDSNRLLSVEELAAYLGVPKKTVYGCWRQWGLRGYRVGRYLRFRERHVEEWLQTREV